MVDEADQQPNLGAPAPETTALNPGGGGDTVTTGDDTVTTGDDTVTTGNDTVTTGNDTVTTGNDTVTTGNDTVTTGDDKTKAPWFQGDQLPADWREQLAGEDKATLNMLKRVTDIPQLVKNYAEAQKTIRDGAMAGGPPEDEAKLAEWRKENNVPEKPEEYSLSLSNGLNLSDDDKKDMAPYFEQFHAMNLNNEQASALIDTYYQSQSAASERIMAQDRVDQVEAIRTMENNWGPDMETNMNLMLAMFQNELPSDLHEVFTQARLANGKALFNEPGILSAFAKIARTVNPVAALVPSGMGSMKDIDAEIKTLEGRMGEDGWHKDAEAQERYQQLIEAREVMRARQAS